MKREASVIKVIETTEQEREALARAMAEGVEGVDWVVFYTKNDCSGAALTTTSEHSHVFTAPPDREEAKKVALQFLNSDEMKRVRAQGRGMSLKA